MGVIASQIISLTNVNSTVYSDADQRKHHSSASLAFVRGNSPGTGEFPAQMASKAENVSIWWSHHVIGPYDSSLTERHNALNSCTMSWCEISITLQWRHNEHDGVSNNQRLDCLHTRLFRRRSKKTSKLRANGICKGSSPMTSEFHAQRASKEENVSIWWRDHYIAKPMPLQTMWLWCINCLIVKGHRLGMWCLIELG